MQPSSCPQAAKFTRAKQRPAASSLAIAALTAWVVGCVDSGEFATTESSSHEIIGGTEVPAGELRAVVPMFILFAGGLCTASIIGPTYALTAAHCVYDAPELEKVAIAIDGVIHNATALHVHPGYGQGDTIIHDIAVIEFSPATEIAPLLLRRTPVEVGTEAMFAGYGYTTPADAEGNFAGQPGTLYRYSEPIASCATWEANSGRNLRDYRQFCIPQTDGTGTCSGDSGGPAIVYGKGPPRIAGVTSYGDKDCTEFGVSTRVDWYAFFIDTVTGGSLPGAFTGDAAEREARPACSGGRCDPDAMFTGGCSTTTPSPSATAMGLLATWLAQTAFRYRRRNRCPCRRPR
ncbi:MAG: trypsin-like serine protease [Myxococcales bacterium]|nr:trypsin-like serine protease [Myxococcales bacterium]